MLRTLLICLALVILVGCQPKTPEQQRARQVDYIIGSIIYFKDAKTGICYAYYWGGSGNGGPALATVPCDKCEPFLVK